MLPWLTFLLSELDTREHWVRERSDYNIAADSGRVELPRSHTIIWHILVVLTGKLEEPQARSQECLSLPGWAAAHSLLFLWPTHNPLRKPKFIRSGWNPLLSWPLFSGGTLRGVLTSGWNEDIRKVGCLKDFITKFYLMLNLKLNSVDYYYSFSVCQVHWPLTVWTDLSPS